MSLLTGFLLDSLLPPSVMQQDVFLANRNDGVLGSGTELDPFSARGEATAGDPPFDQIMRALPVNTTVRLMPGTYYTKGFTGGANGWKPKSGFRIVGSSMTNTILTFANGLGAGKVNAMVGCNPELETNYLLGFEIENLTLDCTIPEGETDLSSAGVSVIGRNLYIHDILVKGFERKGSGPETYGICSAFAYHKSTTPTFSQVSENSVLNSCRVESPAASNGVVGIRLQAESNLQYHKFCVVRNCYVSLVSGTGYVGIASSGGLGTILEHNRIVNCGVGISFAPVGGVVNATRDMIVRHNYIGDTPVAMSFDFGASGQNCERLVLLNNFCDWPESQSVAHMGVSVAGAGSAIVNKLIVRDNIFKRIGINPMSGGSGLSLMKFGDAVVEGNIIEVSDVQKGVQHASTGHFTPFNNRRMDGTLLRGYNTGTMNYDSELEIEAEDVYLAL